MLLLLLPLTRTAPSHRNATPNGSNSSSRTPALPRGRTDDRSHSMRQVGVAAVIGIVFVVLDSLVVVRPPPPLLLLSALLPQPPPAPLPPRVATPVARGLLRGVRL